MDSVKTDFLYARTLLRLVRKIALRGDLKNRLFKSVIVKLNRFLLLLNMYKLFLHMRLRTNYFLYLLINEGGFYFEKI